jgi:hypothetical protein
MILILTQLWVNRLDTGEALSAYTDPDRQQTFDDQVEVRTYANGRRRAISSPGESGELTFRLVNVDLATVTKLRVWKGLDVQIRDHRGQRWFGVFGGVQVREYMDPARYAATITVQTITVAEGV